MSVATIPVGYADGIKRAWGNEKGMYSLTNKSYNTRYYLYGYANG